MKIANAPVSWGVLEFELEGEPPGYGQVLDEMKETGYIGTELGDWDFLPTDSAQLKQELEARNLSLIAAFVPVALANPEAHAPGQATALRAARLMAAVAGEQPFIVLSDDNGTLDARTKHAGRIRPEHGMNDSQWPVFAEGAHRIAQAVRTQTGLRTVFHHHCAGYVETPDEVEKFLSLTEPDLIGLCFDTGHYTYAGGDALQAVRRYAQRIWHLHFKDCHAGLAASSRTQGWDYFEAVQQGVFCELGQGVVDFPAIVAELQKRAYDDWIVVEQDVLPGMGQPKASAQRNRDYLHSIGL